VIQRATGQRVILAFDWGLLMIAAFVGFGSLANRVLYRERRVDWGLRATWGLAVVVVLGGFLLVVHLARAPVLIGLVIVGGALFVDDLLREGRQLVRGLSGGRFREDVWFYAGAASLMLLGALLLYASYGNVGEWSHADDGPAYGMFPKQIAQTGTLFQPFSLRRISSYCGLSFLQAIQFAGSSMDALHLVDRGICAIIMVGLIIGHPRERSSPPRHLALLPALAVLLLPNTRINLASVMSGAVMILGTYRTLAVLPADPQVRPRAWLLLGMVTATAVAFRPFYVIPSVGMVLVAQAMVFWDVPADRPRVRRETALFLGALLVAILPWVVLLMIDCHTPLFPMFKGNLRPHSAFARPDWSYFHLLQVWDGGTLPNAFMATPLVALAGACVLDRSPRRAMRALFVASFAGFFLLMLTMPFTPTNHLERYIFPIDVAFVIGIAGYVLASAHPMRARSASAIILVLIALSLEYPRQRDQARDMYVKIVKDFPETFFDHGTGERDGSDAQYKALQAAIPAGATIGTMVDDAVRLDFARNRVITLDIPGEVGPKPGFPFFEGEEALADYLHRKGIRYLVSHKKPDKSKHLYQLATWRWHANSGSRMPQHFEGKYVLDVLEQVAKLVSVRPHVYEDDTLVVIDLVR